MLLLGEFESGILAQVALFPGHLDVAAVGRDARVDQIVVVLLAPLEAGPRDGEHFGGRGGGGGFVFVDFEKFLQFGPGLDRAGEEGAFVHFFENGRAHNFADEVAGGFAVGRSEGDGHEGLVVGKNLVQFGGSFAVLDRLALDHGDGGLEGFRGDEGGQSFGALGQEPGEKFGVGAALGNAAAQMFAQGFEMALFEEQPGGFDHHLAVALLQDVEQETVAGRAAEGHAGFEGVADAGGRKRGEQPGQVGGRMREAYGEGEGALG